MSRRISQMALIVLGMSTASPVMASGLYNVTNFGKTLVQDINNEGDVVLTQGVYHSYGPNAGHVTTPSEYGLAANASISAINDHGDVVATVQRPGSPNGAYVTNGGAVVSIPSLPDQVSSSSLSLNNAGDVVGIAHVSQADPGNPSGPGTSKSYGFLFQNGNVVKLDPTGTALYANPTAINNSGQVVGVFNAGPTSAPSHGFVYSNGSLVDIGTLGGADSNATGINDLGQITGFSTRASSEFIEHAFIYQNGTMTDLGALSGANGHSQGMGINKSGDVVGVSDGVAALWKSGSILDLNQALTSSLPFRLVWASGINDLGQIIAAGYDPDTHTYHAVLLTPTDLPPAADYVATPEPGTWAVFSVIGLACVLRRRVRS